MPLIKSASRQALAQNIAELHEANKSKPSGKKRSQAQIVAIAFAQKREAQHGK